MNAMSITSTLTLLSVAFAPVHGSEGNVGRFQLIANPKASPAVALWVIDTTTGQVWSSDGDLTKQPWLNQPLHAAASPSPPRDSLAEQSSNPRDQLLRYFEHRMNRDQVKINAMVSDWLGSQTPTDRRETVRQLGVDAKERLQWLFLKQLKAQVRAETSADELPNFLMNLSPDVSVLEHSAADEQAE